MVQDDLKVCFCPIHLISKLFFCMCPSTAYSHPFCVFWESYIFCGQRFHSNLPDTLFSSRDSLPMVLLSHQTFCCIQEQKFFKRHKVLQMHGWFVFAFSLKFFVCLFSTVSMILKNCCSLKYVKFIRLFTCLRIDLYSALTYFF